MDLRILLALTLLAPKAECTYNVLCIFPVATFENKMAAKAFVFSLLEGKYNVTMVSPYNRPLYKPSNLHVVTIKELMQYESALQDAFTKYPGDIQYLKELGNNIGMTTASSKELKDLILNCNNCYDVIVTEWFFTDILAGFAAILKKPWIVVSSEYMHSHPQELADDTSRNNMLVPTLCYYYWEPLTCGILHRISLLKSRREDYFYYQKQKEAYVKLFTELAQMKNTDIIPYDRVEPAMYFTNSHPLVAPVKRNANVINTVGLHMLPRVFDVPPELTKLYRATSNGGIYVNLGPMRNSIYVTDEVKKELMEVFGSQCLTVIWKCDEDLNRPPNVHFMGRIKPYRLFAGEGTRLLITNGDTYSILEALHFGIPMIIVPLLASHKRNAFNAVKLGYAIEVSYGSKMAADIDAAIKKIFNDNSYAERAKELSLYFYKDHPISTAKVVLYYVDMVISTGGAIEFRNKTPAETNCKSYICTFFIIIAIYIVVIINNIKNKHTQGADDDTQRILKIVAAWNDRQSREKKKLEEQERHREETREKWKIELEQIERSRLYRLLSEDEKIEYNRQEKRRKCLELREKHHDEVERHIRSLLTEEQLKNKVQTEREMRMESRVWGDDNDEEEYMVEGPDGTTTIKKRRRDPHGRWFFGQGQQDTTKMNMRRTMVRPPIPPVPPEPPVPTRNLNNPYHC